MSVNVQGCKKLDVLWAIQSVVLGLSNIKSLPEITFDILSWEIICTTFDPVG